ncbi:MAG: UbiX family flavin prenyltransferase [Lachnospiraceae bacterium]|nr:UbiX family flavin prenyltransferase [Lachnospiraceae bacterium]
MAKRLIIGMSGASGAPLTVELLRQLRAFHPQVETHLVVTRGGEMTLRQETGLTLEDIRVLAAVYHENDNIGAAIASGSFHTLGMAVVPCSMKTVAGIVSGYSDNLLLRAADVCMKEQRKLVLVPREAPLSTLHLRNLYEASQLGAVILPPMQTYYDHPQTVEDMTRQTVGRILSQFGLGDQSDVWTGMNEA